MNSWKISDLTCVGTTVVLLLKPPCSVRDTHTHLISGSLGPTERQWPCDLENAMAPESSEDDVFVT